MENKFTPGPWEVATSYGGMGAHYLIKAKDNYVGHFYDEDGGCPNGEENATLMTAAPELLEALEALRDNYLSKGKKYNEAEVQLMASRIIKKAKGE